MAANPYRHAFLSVLALLFLVTTLFSGGAALDGDTVPGDKAASGGEVAGARTNDIDRISADRTAHGRGGDVVDVEARPADVSVTGEALADSGSPMRQGLRIQRHTVMAGDGSGRSQPGPARPLHALRDGR